VVEPADLVLDERERLEEGALGLGRQPLQPALQHRDRELERRGV